MRLTVILGTFGFVCAFLSTAHVGKGPFGPHLCDRNADNMRCMSRTSLLMASTDDIMVFNDQLSRSKTIDEADEIYRQMLESEISPDRMTYELMAFKFLQDTSDYMEGQNSLQEAELIINQLLKEGHMPSNPLIKAMIHKYAVHRVPEKADAFFNLLSFSSPDSDEKTLYDVEIYNALILCWAQSGGHIASTITTAIDPSSTDTMSSITSTETILMDNSDFNAPLNAEQWFKRLKFSGLKPTKKSFEALLVAWTHSNRSDAPYKSFNILNELIDKFGVEINISLFEDVFGVWTRSKNPEALERLSELKKRMEEVNVPLSQKCYDFYIEAMFYCEEQKAVASHIQILIEEMINAKMSLVCAYLTLSKSLLRFRQLSSLARVESLLVILEEQLLSEGELVMLKYNSTVEDIYAKLVDRWAEEGLPHRAEAVLDALMSRHKKSNSSESQRTMEAAMTSRFTLVWNSVISAYGRLSRESAKISLDILPIISKDVNLKKDAGNNESEDTSDKDKDKDKGSLAVTNAMKAQNLYEKMKRYRVLPDSWTYSTLISIWANVGYPQKALRLISDMTALGLGPSSVIYFSLINGWLSSITRHSKAEAGSSSGSSRDSTSSLHRIATLFEAMCHESITVIKKKAPSLLSTGRIIQSIDTSVEPSVNARDSEFYCLETFQALSDFYLDNLPISVPKSMLRVLLAGVHRKHSAISPSNYIKQALDVFKRVVVNEIDLDAECYELLLKVLDGAMRKFGKGVSFGMKVTMPDRAFDIVQNLVYEYQLEEESLLEDPENIVDLRDILLQRKPTMQLYESLLNIWLFSERSDSARKVETIFRSMISVLGVQPSLKSFKILMRAYLRSGLPNAADKVEEVYTTMLTAQVEPDATVFSILARVHSNSWRDPGPFPVVVQEDGSVKRIDYRSRTEDAYERCIDAGFEPDMSIIRSLLFSYTKFPTRASILSAEDILVSMAMKIPTTLPGLDNEVAIMINELIPLHPIAYSQVAQAWSQLDNGLDRDTLECARSLERRITEEGGRGQQLYIAQNMMLAALATKVSDSREDATYLTRAEDLIGNMITARESTDSEKVHVDSTSMNLMLEVYRNLRASSDDGDSSAVSRVRHDPVKKAQTLLERCSRIGVLPNDYTFKVMVSIWKDQNIDDIASRAQDLFERIWNAKAYIAEKEISDIRREILPADFTFHTLIDIWSVSNPKYAMDTMERMLDLGVKIRPSVYTRLMSSWSRLKNADMCELVLNKMISQDVIPDADCCKELLNTLASSDRVDSAERTETAMKTIIAVGVKVDESMLQSQMLAWAKSSSPLAQQKAEEAMQRGVAAGLELTTPLFNILLDIIGKSRKADAPEQTEKVLENMIALKLRPDISTYNAVIAAWGRSSHPQAETRARRVFDRTIDDEQVEADTITYGSLLSALSNSNDDDAAVRATEVFEAMLAAKVEPDTISWTILISIWARSSLPNHELEAQAIFDRMLRYGSVPNAVTYTALLTMWSNSGAKDATKKVVSIFRHMTMTGQKLDTVGYSSLLSALSRTSDPEAALRANEVFEQMLEANVEPDTMSWTILISIWASSPLPNHELEAQAIFDRMLQYGTVPNAVTYTTMLKMWMYSKRFKIAQSNVLKIYDRIYNDHVSLDAFSFRWLLKSLDKYFKQKEAFTKVIRLLKRMIDYGILPDMSTWSTVITSDNVSGNIDSIVQCMNIIRQSGAYLAPQVVNDLLLTASKTNLESISTFTHMMTDLLKGVSKTPVEPRIIAQMMYNIASNSGPKYVISNLLITMQHLHSLYRKYGATYSLSQPCSLTLISGKHQKGGKTKTAMNDTLGGHLYLSMAIGFSRADLDSVSEYIANMGSISRTIGPVEHDGQVDTSRSLLSSSFKRGLYPVFVEKYMKRLYELLIESSSAQEAWSSNDKSKHEPSLLDFLAAMDSASTLSVLAKAYNHENVDKYLTDESLDDRNDGEMESSDSEQYLQHAAVVYLISTWRREGFLRANSLMSHNVLPYIHARIDNDNNIKQQWNDHILYTAWWAYFGILKDVINSNQEDLRERLVDVPMVIGYFKLHESYEIALSKEVDKALPVEGEGALNQYRKRKKRMPYDDRSKQFTQLKQMIFNQKIAIVCGLTRSELGVAVDLSLLQDLATDALRAGGLHRANLEAGSRFEEVLIRLLTAKDWSEFDSRGEREESDFTGGDDVDNVVGLLGEIDGVTPNMRESFWKKPFMKQIVRGNGKANNRAQKSDRRKYY